MEGTTEAPKMTLHRFSAEYCPSCRGMKRARTAERFAELYRNVKLIDWDMSGEDEKAEDKADDYGIKGIPAFVFEDDEGNILAQHEGATNFVGLEKVYKAALQAHESGDFGSVPRKRRRRRE